MPERIVVVFDTNVLIPLILRASRSVRVFSRLDLAGHLVVASPQIIEEVRDKMISKQSLRRWLRVTEADLDQFLNVTLPGMLGEIPGNYQHPGVVTADPDDDKIVAAAVESGASYIISEDPHLLDLREYQGIKIMSRDDFATELDRLGVP